MFKEGTIQQRYEEALYVRTKTRRIAKTVAIVFMIVFGLFVAIGCLALGLEDEALSTGELLLLFAGFPGGYLYGYIFASEVSWTYYWWKFKFKRDDLIFITLLTAGYVGLFVWLKYRNAAKRLKKELEGAR